MGRDQQRILGLLMAFGVLAIASMFVMDWFVADLGMTGARITIDLRSVSVCMAPNPCVSLSLGSIKGSGMFPMFATAAFWSTILVALVVIFQAGTRLLAGTAQPLLSRIGMVGGVVAIGATIFAGYILAPDGTGAARMAMMLSVERTWAPLLLLLGHVAGMLVLHYASLETYDDDAGTYRPVSMPAAPGGAVAGAAGIEVAPAAPRGEVAPSVPAPDHLRKRISYVALAAELTRGGVDARREDGSLVLVMWRDVVGAVARRLPPELDGHAFIDLVSAAGSTLRLVPWTRLTGDPVPGTGDARLRAFIGLVVERCAEAALDPATRRFVDGAEPPAQLPDVATLAAHDARLA